MAGRRVNGEGTIYRRKDGRYEGACYCLTASGKRKRLRFYGKTRQEVHDKLTEIKGHAQRGIPMPDRAWKLSEYFDYWLEHGVQIKRRPMTYRRHEMVVRLYLKPGLGTRMLRGLSVQTVQAFLDQLHADGQSAANIHQVRKVLSAALTYAMRQELIFRNVARLVELPSYRPAEAEHWTPDEAARFLRAAQPDPLYPAFLLLVLYGLRRGEVLGLRWCDVDFDQGVVRIRQQIQRINGKLRQVGLKTRESERDEPLLATVGTALLEQRDRQVASRTRAGDGWHGAGTEAELVFTTRTGQPIEPRNLYRSFLRICDEHSIRRITVHGMRHTNATTQKGLNVHPRIIQAVLGHGDVRTTGIYEHVDIESKRDALQKVESRLFEQVASDGSEFSRQIGLLSRQFVAQITSTFSGGPSGIRTHDTRLKSNSGEILPRSLSEMQAIARARYRASLAGGIAVTAAVKDNSLPTPPDPAGSHSHSVRPVQ